MHKVGYKGHPRIEQWNELAVVTLPSRGRPEENILCRGTVDEMNRGGVPPPAMHNAIFKRSVHLQFATNR